MINDKQGEINTSFINNGYELHCHSLNKTEVQISNMLTGFQLNVKCVYITL